jgi:hypothetical protein
VRELSDEAVSHLNEAMAEAAGVNEVAAAVGASWRYRGRVATGWPVASWIRRIRPDPLRRLHLTGGPKGDPSPTGVQHTSIRAWQTVPAARVDSALRTLADDSVQKLPRAWQQAVQRAARSQETTLPDQLDLAIGGTDLKVDKRPGWWALVKVLQVVFFIGFVGGLAWLALNLFGEGFLGLPVPKPTVGRVPVATLVAAGGLLLGLLFAALAKAGVAAQARVKEESTRRTLRRAIAGVAASAVVEPVNAELRRHNQAREALDLLA